MDEETIPKEWCFNCRRPDCQMTKVNSAASCPMHPDHKEWEAKRLETNNDYRARKTIEDPDYFKRIAKKGRDKRRAAKLLLQG